MKIVLKVGSSTLTYASGRLNLRFIENLVRVICDLKGMGHDVILVTSGAQVAGMTKLKLKKKPKNTPKRQALAAVGQGELMSIYDRFFDDYGCNMGQILMNKEVLQIPSLKANLTNTFKALLRYGCVPVVNENDSVEVDEIKFGDNDTLSAVVASCVKADRLIILTDIDALYTANPAHDPDAKPIRVVEKITDDVRALAGDTISNKGTGGMITKIRAAEIATGSGTQMHIVCGHDPRIIFDVIENKEVGTKFTVPHRHRTAEGQKV